MTRKVLVASMVCALILAMGWGVWSSRAEDSADSQPDPGRLAVVNHWKSLFPLGEPHPTKMILGGTEEDFIRLHLALDKKVDLSKLSREITLGHFLEAMSTELGINISYDLHPLDEIRITEGSKLKIGLRETVSARAALDIVLEENDPELTFAMKDDGLLVTTRERDSETSIARMFDVTDLCYSVQQDGSLRWDVEPLTELVADAIEETKPRGQPPVIEVSPFQATGIQAMVVTATMSEQHQVDELLAVLREMRRDPGWREASGDGAPTEFVPKSTRRVGVEDAIVAARVQTALRQKIDLTELGETIPLDKFAKLLSEKTGVPVEIDARRLELEGLPPHLPLSPRFSHQTTVATALDHVLASAGSDLVWGVQHGMLWITAGDEDDVSQLRLYDVADLVGCLPGEQTGNCDFDSLSMAITVSVAPDRWPSGSGPGVIEPYEYGGLRIISVPGDWQLHEELERFLAAMRRQQHSAPPDGSAPGKPAKRKQKTARNKATAKGAHEGEPGAKTEVGDKGKGQANADARSSD